MTNSQQSKALPITELLTKEIKTWNDVFYCTRVQEAWQYGTMTQDDFEQLSDTEAFTEIIEEV